MCILSKITKRNRFLKTLFWNFAVGTGCILCLNFCKKIVCGYLPKTFRILQISPKTAKIRHFSNSYKTVTAVTFKKHNMALSYRGFHRKMCAQDIHNELCRKEHRRYQHYSSQRNIIIIMKSKEQQRRKNGSYRLRYKSQVTGYQRFSVIPCHIDDPFIFNMTYHITFGNIFQYINKKDELFVLNTI